jgi:predicted site-specific integrase-resolvase
LYARATSIDQKCDLDRHMPAVTWAIRFRPGMLFWELVNSLHGLIQTLVTPGAS